MTVAFQRMFGIFERWNKNQLTPSLSKQHESSYKSNILTQIFIIAFKIGSFLANTSMATVNPIFHTFLIGLGRYGL